MYSRTVYCKANSFFREKFLALANLLIYIIVSGEGTAVN